MGGIGDLITKGVEALAVLAADAGHAQFLDDADGCRVLWENEGDDAVETEFWPKHVEAERE